ncbi:putative pentatricopeptide repeat-containing protein isoform X1 [Iris pallida]|uniref:Pentatricopeptide repeat-containing protein isoform X1 n=1 Tax=Iris pallida TaxID=29817 RepID=A0AAX6E291_IRIPA|nr:putative pentatricopeptide repeat-containing protein isoform X1 [Iris pallida]
MAVSEQFISAPVLRQTPSIHSLLTSNCCKSLRSLTQIHSQMVRRGLEQQPVLLSLFLVLCNSLSALPYAVSVFDAVSEPNLVLYNTLLKAHSDHRSPLSASLSLLRRMRRRHHPPLHPDKYTFTSLFKLSALAPDLPFGSSLHCAATCYGLDSNVFVRTALIDFYGKCGEIRSARKLFDEMPHRNEVSWTAMIVGYLAVSDLDSARSLFYEMPRRNTVTWNAVIDGCVKCGDLVNAKKLFEEMPEKNSITFTSMIDGYAKAGDMASARALFQEGKLAGKVDAFSWSVMISGYAQNGRPAEALKIFMEMHDRKIRIDEFVAVGLMSACAQLGSIALARWVDSYIVRSMIDVRRAHVLAALIDMNAKCGDMERATELFEGMWEKDLILYCSMMQGYSIHSYEAKAVELFSRMLREGVFPDGVAFTVVLTACSYAGLVEEGKHYFQLMRNKYFIAPSSDHYACMVDLLGRGGHLREAYELIKSMPMEPHAGAWGALLGACRLHSDLELGQIVAKRLFEVEPQNGGNYVLLSNIYAAADRWADVSQVRTMMRGRGIKKVPGCTWI